MVLIRRLALWGGLGLILLSSSRGANLSGKIVVKRNAQTNATSRTCTIEGEPCDEYAEDQKSCCTGLKCNKNEETDDSAEEGSEHICKRVENCGKYSDACGKEHSNRSCCIGLPCTEWSSLGALNIVAKRCGMFTKQSLSRKTKGPRGPGGQKNGNGKPKGSARGARKVIKI